MIRRGGLLVTALITLSALLTACSGPNNEKPAGDTPVPGGTARIVQMTEPRSLDPATLGNQWVLNALLGNALFGTLMINDPQTGAVEFTMAESFASHDGGATFELTLRPGLRFSDGTPLDAAAVEFNWDRVKDPANGAAHLQEASMMAATTVVGTNRLAITMAEPVPNFAEAINGTPLNWIASPAALAAGRHRFDSHPVGAGPFTLRHWARGDTIELVRNPGYWDAPKPYLDAITLRSNGDTRQRINTLISDGADLVIETNPASLAEARAAGFPTDTVPLHGGQNLTMNTRRPPFDDVRARRAVAAAIDFDAIDVAIYQGESQVPTTLFGDTSPFHTDQPLPRPDRQTAQRLFDELAAEGKPVSFTFTSGPTAEIRALAENVQAQLSAFGNVKVEVAVADITEVIELRRTNDFDMTTSSANFTDPEPALWSAFHRTSRRNLSGIDDAELSRALRDGRAGTTAGQRTDAYRRVQERLNTLVPVLFQVRNEPSVVSRRNVGGVVQYGYGSLLPEELWVEN
ncbi:ABC transporter substrate-binding protein [Nocardia carnea]|uniref:ABC transporter substrate-binding protein n=1 Tax=Nocardia carnea TaxID=37328 RepID=UPI00245532DD|nr:ABC transporter substrate-binding protein [Nocardia carnea]